MRLAFSLSVCTRGIDDKLVISENNRKIQITSFETFFAATISASHVESATILCLLLNQVTADQNI